MFAGLWCGTGADGDHREDPDLHCVGEGSVFLHCGGRREECEGVMEEVRGTGGFCWISIIMLRI